MAGLLEYNDKGIYCRQADVYIDPWKAVKKAFITHAHSDHARPGSQKYLSVHESREIIKHRLKTDKVDSVAFGEKVMVNGVQFSFHPAGHIIGSAQIRVEYKGEIWVVSGDYKTENDSVSGHFESLKCHTFISECTFGLPVFNWRPQKEILHDINTWWANNADQNKITCISAYSLGKSQRLLSGLDTTIGKIYTHIAVENINEIFRKSGVKLPDTNVFTPDIKKEDLKGSIVIGPQSFMNSKAMAKFKNVAVASASGWMNLRGARRRSAVDRGFVLSDHADWSGLLSAIENSEAEKILVTHGYVNVFSKYLKSLGYDADILQTEYEGETLELENQSNEGVQ